MFFYHNWFPYIIQILEDSICLTRNVTSRDHYQYNISSESQVCDVDKIVFKVLQNTFEDGYSGI